MRSIQPTILALYSFSGVSIRPMESDRKKSKKDLADAWITFSVLICIREDDRAFHYDFEVDPWSAKQCSTFYVRQFLIALCRGREIGRERKCLWVWRIYCHQNFEILKHLVRIMFIFLSFVDSFYRIQTNFHSIIEHVRNQSVSAYSSSSEKSPNCL